MRGVVGEGPEVWVGGGGGWLRCSVPETQLDARSLILGETRCDYFLKISKES